MDGNSDRKLQTLNLLLAEPAPELSELRRTPETRAKETVDNDVGDTITLAGSDDTLQVDVTVTKVEDPAKPDNKFFGPKKTNRYVAVQVELTVVGDSPYSDSSTNGGVELLAVRVDEVRATSRAPLGRTSVVPRRSRLATHAPASSRSSPRRTLSRRRSSSRWTPGLAPRRVSGSCRGSRW